jgi:hypothetical protein
LSQTEEANDFTNMENKPSSARRRYPNKMKAVLNKPFGDETISAEVESDVMLRSGSINIQHREYGGLSSRLQQLQDLEMQKSKNISRQSKSLHKL